MEKKTRVKRAVLGVLTLTCLALIYPLLNIGDVKRTNAQTINLADIAKHSSAGDCWLIVNGKVYNVTNFLSQHSGGASTITPYCGKDATAAFSGKPHPGSDLNALSVYYIGNVGAILSPTPTSTPSPAPQLQSLPNPSSVPASILTKIVISPTAISMRIGGTKSFKAAAYDQNNKLMTGTAIIYSSSDVNIGTIDSAGSFIAKNIGSILITASGGQVKSTAKVVVTGNQTLSDPIVSSTMLLSASDILKKSCDEIYGNDHDDGDIEKEEDEADNNEEEDQAEALNMKNHSKNFHVYGENGEGDED